MWPNLHGFTRFVAVEEDEHEEHDEHMMQADNHPVGNPKRKV
jgi:hypothetical protein